jgi:glycosyltransferase involved in cell wall biosynthesis
MDVSVVICTYTMDRYDVFTEAIESVVAQTYDPAEVVIVIDGNPEVYERTVTDFGDRENLVISNNENNEGISYSRTKGAELASGEIVAFIDDDGVAEEDWIANLVDVYEETDAIAVGGDVRPNWRGERPDFFPEEFYWLVGCVEPGFAEDGEEVRNTYGSNISYRREAFLEIGGYDPNTGRKGEKHLQAHEAPVGIRLLEEFGRGMVYTEDAVVHHTLFEYRGQFRWLVFRSFWQGYSKRVMDLLYPTAPDEKRDYLRWLMLERIPRRALGFVRSPSVARGTQIGTIGVLTISVGFGYIYAMTQSDLVKNSNS